MPLDISSNTAESLMTAIYGSAATIIGVITVYQGRRAWLMWYNSHHARADHAVDLELGPTESYAATERPENHQHGDVDVVEAPNHNSAVFAPRPTLIQPH